MFHSYKSITIKILTFKRFQRHEASQLAKSTVSSEILAEEEEEKKGTNARTHARVGRGGWLKVLTSRMFNFTANMVSHIKRVSGSNKPGASAVKWHQSGRSQVSSLALLRGCAPR